MYNIVFFTDVTDNIASIPAIGAYKLAHVLRKNDYKVLVVNHFSDYDLSELKSIIDIAVSDRTLLVGFSTTFFRNINVDRNPNQPTPSYPDLETDTFCPQGKEFETKLIELLHQRNSKIKILVGGTKVSAYYSNRNVQYVCLGYGEVSVLNLADHLFHKKDLKKSYKNVWGITVIDDRLAPDYKFRHEDMQWLPEDVVNHKTLPIEIARGCIFQCKFCSYPMNGKQNLDFVKSEQNIFKELQRNYHEFGIENYLMVDDTFNDHPDKLSTMRNIIRQLDFQPKFWGYHRLDLICTRPSTLQILHDIGVRAMYFGIETMHPETAKIIGKGFDRHKQISMLETIRNKYSDISIHGSFIVGLPKESEDDVVITHMQLLSQEIPLHSWQFQGLLLTKKEFQTYNSEFDLNYLKYDYQEQESSGSKYINWRNQYFTAARASELAAQFRQESYVSDKLHLSGLLSLIISTMNHPAYNFESNWKTLFKDFDFNFIEHTIRINFVADYKKKLLQIVSDQVAEGRNGLLVSLIS
jgi:radical SAM superfamily enzyme YgiQ (UPF0313 family)